MIRRSSARHLAKKVAAEQRKASVHIVRSVTALERRISTLSQRISQTQTLIERPKLEPEGLALCLIPHTSRLRILLARVVQSSMFESFILLAIVVNCVFLALDENDDTRGAIQLSEKIFLTIFTMEMTFKVLAFGFYFTGPSAYLRDTWNVLDFIVVVTGLASLASSQFNLTAARSLRLLRPLRTIHSIPGMRVLVTSILAALPSLIDVLGLLIFIMFVFGIVGMQLYKGKFLQRCLDPVTRELAPQASRHISVQLCSMSTSKGRQCPTGQVCGLYATNPNRGVTSFDNILVAWIAIVQSISLEGWVDIMYWTEESDGAWNQLFFLALILVGSFFVVNLIVAVIVIRFDQSKHAQDVNIALIDHHKLIVSASVQALEKIKEKGEKGGKDKEGEPHAIIIPIAATAAATEAKKKQNALASSTSPSSSSSPPLSSSSSILFRLVSSKPFRNVITAAIVLNTLFLAIDHHNMDKQLENYLEWFNFVLTQLFAVEMILKMMGLGMRGYLADSFNVFDCLIVFVSEAELVFSSGGSLSVLRAFRMLRIFKLLREWHSLRRLLQAVLQSIRELFYFSLVLILFLFIYAVLGVQLFEGKFVFDGVQARSHFDNFYWALISVFHVLSGENWNDMLYDGIAASGWGASVYFISLFVLGNYVVLSLFLAILLGNFENVDDGEGVANRLTGSTIWQDMFDRLLAPCRRRTDPDMVSVAQTSQDDSEDEEEEEEEEEEDNDIDKFLNNTILHTSAATKPFQVFSDSSRGGSSREGGGGGSTKPFLLLKDMTPRSSFHSGPGSPRDSLASVVPAMASTKKHSHRRHISRRFTKRRIIKRRKQRTSRHTIKRKTTRTTLVCLHGFSCCVWAPRHPFRIRMARIVTSSWFDYAIFFFIFVSAVLLALDSPDAALDKSDSTLAQVVWWGDVLVTTVFTAEMIAKIIALGLVFHEGAYLRDGWNVLDFFIVALSILNFSVGSLKFFKGFRAARALRPLRLISRFESMRLIVNSIFAAVPALGNVLLVASLFFLVFGILGVQFFKGRLARCETPIGGDFVPHLDKAPCLAAGNVWSNPSFGSFDNFGSSVLLLFQVATLEMWPQIMFLVVDSTPPDQAPRIENTPEAALFFVAFIIVCSFFVISLFVGVVVDEYTRKRAKFTGSATITPMQVRYLEAYKEMVYVIPPRKLLPPLESALSCCCQRGQKVVPIRLLERVPTASLADLVGKHVNNDVPMLSWELRLRHRVFWAIVDPRFEVLISILICINMVVMSLEYYDSPASYTTVLDFVNQIFTYLFTAEMLLKWTGLGFAQYFRDSWNRFDCVIVIISLVAIGIEGVAGQLGLDPTILRVFRVLRIFRIVKRAKGLRQLIRTLVFSLPALYDIVAIMVLLFFIYACIGMALFGDVVYGEFLNEHANFRTFPKAMMLLFRCVTGESWNGLMVDCQVQAPRCTPGVNCGDPILATLFFISFVVLSTFLMLNVFVAVVLKNFESEVAKDQDVDASNPVTVADIKRFAAQWAHLAPTATMSVSTLISFLLRLPAPLGFAGCERIQVMRALKALRIPLDSRDHTVHYLDVCLALTEQVFQQAQQEKEMARAMHNNNDEDDEKEEGKSGIEEEEEEEEEKEEEVVKATRIKTTTRTTDGAMDKAKEQERKKEEEEEERKKIHDGIPTDNEMMLCIKAEAFRTYPELKKLRRYEFCSADAMAVRFISRWWLRVRQRRIEDLHTQCMASSPGEENGEETGLAVPIHPGPALRVASLDAGRIAAEADDHRHNGRKHLAPQRSKTMFVDRKDVFRDRGVVSPSQSITPFSAASSQHDTVSASHRMAEFFEELQLTEYLSAFGQEKVSFDDLAVLCQPQFTPELTKLMPHVGPRLRLIDAVHKKLLQASNATGQREQSMETIELLS